MAWSDVAGAGVLEPASLVTAVLQPLHRAAATLNCRPAHEGCLFFKRLLQPFPIRKFAGDP